MTDRKRPEDEPSDEEVYVIDDTGDLQEVQDLAGYREMPVPVEESDEEPTLARPGSTSEGGENEEIRRENMTLRDQLLRSRADFENFRKRAERERSDFFRYALADTFRELLPVLDNFERALATGGEVPDEFRTGIEMIYKQLSDILSRSGLKVLEPKGE
ncbi:MAG TPA: nucleotide exchange factor GrpE, partial [Thermoanaerobaculia bacterium]|nr:nucleotide exchange factor GrpE [Thermoanaerobaculia bacterium]